MSFLVFRYLPIHLKSFEMRKSKITITEQIDLLQTFPNFQIRKGKVEWLKKANNRYVTKK